MHPIFERLKERKIVQWALAYVAGAVALYSALDAFAEPWGVGDFQLRIAQVGLLVGFFVAVTLAWYHGERGEQRVTGVELLILAGIMGLGAIGVRVVWGAPTETARVEWAGVVQWSQERIAPNQRAGTVDIQVASNGITYRGPGAIWLRPWDSEEAIPIDGTRDHTSWWVSPDGRLIAFNLGAEADRDVQIVEVPHGVSEPVPSARGGVRGVDDDGYVYFQEVGDRTTLWRTHADDTVVVEVARAVGHETALRNFWPLPGGRHVLLDVETGDRSQIVAITLSTGERTTITEGRRARYTDAGYLVFQDENRLIAGRFDFRSLSLDPELVEVAGVGAYYELSPEGVLAYVADGATASHEFVWVDRSGAVEQFDPDWRFDPSGASQSWSLSPLGDRVALIARVGGQLDVWVKPGAREVAYRLTRDSVREFTPRWSSDGARVTFITTRDGSDYLLSLADDGTDERIEYTDETLAVAEGFLSPSGQWVVLRTSSPRDILLAARDDDAPVVPIAADPAVTYQNAAVSPSERWLAYVSDETGRAEVYVLPFPDPGGAAPRPVSSGGGVKPVWAPSGTELYYVRRETRKMVAASVEADSVFRVLSQRELFTIPEDIVVNTTGRADFYDVSPEGQRFLMARQSPEDASRFVFVVGFAARLAELLPN